MTHQFDCQVLLTNGIDKRTWLAGLAMQGDVAKAGMPKQADILAKVRTWVTLADMLLIELEATK